MNMCERCGGPKRDDQAICDVCFAKAQDAINPAHYKGDYVMRIIEDFGLGFCLGNVVKYVLRAENKGRVEDLRKAAWYLDREIARLSK